MPKFARIIELDNKEQALLVVEYNEETDLYDFVITTYVYGFRVSMKICFEQEKTATEAMDDFPTEEAVVFRTKMEKLLK